MCCFLRCYAVRQICLMVEGRRCGLSDLVALIAPLAGSAADANALRTTIVDLAQRRNYADKDGEHLTWPCALLRPLSPHLCRSCCLVRLHHMSTLGSSCQMSRCVMECSCTGDGAGGLAAADDAAAGTVWFWEVRDPKKHITDKHARKVSDLSRKRRKEVRAGTWAATHAVMGAAHNDCAVPPDIHLPFALLFTLQKATAHPCQRGTIIVFNVLPLCGLCAAAARPPAGCAGRHRGTVQAGGHG